MSSHFIEEPNVSFAWARAIRLVSARGQNEISPLIVSITGFDEQNRAQEDAAIRTSLETMLIKEGHQKLDTVASTIFPQSLWNPAKDRAELFQRYQRAFPRIQKSVRGNVRGTYFERMITGGPAHNPNQLDYILQTFLARSGVRRSALQLSIFDPQRDHIAGAQLGFPCLQHVTFAPSGDSLTVNAFYALHYMVERAYGNYLGLCRLGQFVAHETGLKLTRVTCYAGIAKLDANKRSLATVLSSIDTVLGSQ